MSSAQLFGSNIIRDVSMKMFLRFMNFLLLNWDVSYYGFINIGVMVYSTVTHAEQISPNTSFLHKARHRLLALRARDSPSQLFLLAILGSKFTNKKHAHKKCEKCDGK